MTFFIILANIYRVPLQGGLLSSAPKPQGGRISQISVVEGIFENGLWEVIREPRGIIPD